MQHQSGVSLGCNVPPLSMTGNVLIGAVMV